MFYIVVVTFAPVGLKTLGTTNAKASARTPSHSANNSRQLLTSHLETIGNEERESGPANRVALREQ